MRHHIRPVHNPPILFSEILVHEIVLVNERGEWTVLVVAAALGDPSVGRGDRAVLMLIVDRVGVGSWVVLIAGAGDRAVVVLKVVESVIIV